MQKNVANGRYFDPVESPLFDSALLFSMKAIAHKKRLTYQTILHCALYRLLRANNIKVSKPEIDFMRRNTSLPKRGNTAKIRWSPRLPQEYRDAVGVLARRLDVSRSDIFNQAIETYLKDLEIAENS